MCVFVSMINLHVTLTQACVSIFYLFTYHLSDTSLLSPQNSPTPVEFEMAHEMHWARENKMSLNLLKTAELVFRRPDVSGDLLHQHSQTLIECATHSCSESTLDIILISASMPSQLLLFVTKDFTCLHNLKSRALVYMP